MKKLTLPIAIVLGAFALTVASSAVAANKTDIGATGSDIGYVLTFGDAPRDDAWTSDAALYIAPNGANFAVLTSGVGAGKSRIAILNEALYPDAPAWSAVWLICADGNCLVP